MLRWLRGPTGTMRAAAVVALLVFVPRARAQMPVRFTPPPGTVLHSVFSARASLVLRDVTGGVVAPDSLMAEYTAIGAVGRKIVEVRGSERVMDVRLDSLRTRARLEGQAWKDVTLGDSARTTIRVTVDDRLRFGPVPAGEQASQIGLVRAFGWMALEFPEEPVGPSGRWTVRGSARLPAELASLHRVVMPESLETVLSVVLDSVTVRQADTLLFLSFQGSMGPATVAGMDAGDSATVALAGAQAGSLIWSSGWQAFVGGAIQTKVRVRLTVATERASREAELLWTVTSRLQVRL